MAASRTHPLYTPPLGATLRDGGVEVRVYAPHKARVVLVMDGAETEMRAEGEGYWAAFVPGAGVGSRYGLRLADAPGAPLGPPFPDPCSRAQPGRRPRPERSGRPGRVRVDRRSMDGRAAGRLRAL